MVNFKVPLIQKREVIGKFQSTPYPETRGVLVNFNLPGGPYPEAIIEGLGRPCPYPEAIIEGRGQPDPYPEAIIEGRGRPDPYPEAIIEGRGQPDPYPEAIEGRGRPDPYPEAIIEGRGRPGALSRNGKGISKFQSTPYPETGGYW